MSTINAALFLLGLSILASCQPGGGGGGKRASVNSDENNAPQAITHHEAGRSVASLGSLPTCDDFQEGKLFYVSDSFEFKTCHSNSWGDIDVRGPQGTAGVDGEVGAQGIQGLKGDKGDTGDTGAQGPIGLTGATGPQGAQGPEGTVKFPVRFTRGTINTTDAIEVKDALCVSEFGSQYETANHLELGYYISFGYGGYFNTHWTNRMELKSVLSGGFYYQRIGIAAVTTGLNSAACIFKPAPIRVTRSTISSSSSDALKDALCVSEFGSSYQALSKYEFSYHKQIETSGQMVVAGSTTAVGVSGNNSWTGAATTYLACIKND